MLLQARHITSCGHPGVNWGQNQLSRSVKTHTHANTHTHTHTQLIEWAQRIVLERRFLMGQKTLVSLNESKKCWESITSSEGAKQEEVKCSAGGGNNRVFPTG